MDRSGTGKVMHVVCLLSGAGFPLFNDGQTGL